MKRMSTMVMKLEHRERREISPSWHVKYRSGFTTLPPTLLQEQPAVVLSLERAKVI
jgi:hypothetical protein